MRTIYFFCFIFFFQVCKAQSADTTFAEKLGYPKGAKVLILHVDDAGMSYDSNEGVIEAITKGASTSCSVMMPCPWVPGFVHYLQAHPGIDAGLHLTLTAEWQQYRWPPVASKDRVPGLIDPEGYLWPSVEAVVKHASADEVATEIQAQLDLALKMGFTPTHIDSHMGTLFASPAFLQRYIKLGIKYHIPVMLPGGHDVLIKADMKASDAMIEQMRSLGKTLWAAGLPVLDDLHNLSYDWKPTDSIAADDKKLQAFKTAKYIEALKTLQPGVTMMIMHCTKTSEVFAHISDSGPVRKGDLLAMTDPVFKAALAKENIILTTWRELKQKRDLVH